MTDRGTRTVAVVAVLGLLSAGGCASDGDDDSKKDARAKPTVNLTAKVPSGDNGDLEQPRGAINALREFRCSPNPAGAWNASGVLRNDAKEAKRFLISVSVVRTKTSEVLGQVDKTYKMAPGMTQRLVMKDILTDSAHKRVNGRSCVPRVVAGN